MSEETKEVPGPSLIMVECRVGGNSTSLCPYLTESDESASRMSTILRGSRFAPRVPQTILQQTLSEATSVPPSSDLLKKMTEAMSKRLHGYSHEQMEVICSNMTRMELAVGSVIVPEGKSMDGVYYVESGILKSSDGVHLIMTGGTVGGVFGESGGESTEGLGESSQPGLIASEPNTVVWEISRLLFQAVLIQDCKSQTKNKTDFLNTVPLLAPLSEQQRHRLSDVMKIKTFQQGQTIIKQGDENAKTMYFVQSGEVTIFQSIRGEAEPKKMSTISPGGYYGEMALLVKEEPSAPSTTTTAAAEGGAGAGAGAGATPGAAAPTNVGVRNASCVATKRTKCYCLDRDDMLNMLGPLQELMLIKSKARTLSAVELLSSMSDREREEVARLMVRTSYALNEVIIKQGDDGDEFFIVESGEVTFTRVQEKEEGEEEGEDGGEGEGVAENIGIFFATQFFGEGSLLTNKPRRATATASKDDTVLYVLSGKSFRETFGNRSAVKTKLSDALETRKAADNVAGLDSSTIQASDLNAIQVLGEGSYGQVTLVRHATSGRTFALKQIKKKHVEKMKQEKHIQTERHVLSTIHHPFVCNLVTTYKNLHSVYFLMEAVMGGELYNQLKKMGKFSPAQARMYSAQVVLVFEHLHMHDIIFRDLKPENLLIDTCGYLKVVDFGLAKQVLSGKTYTLCGTPAYASPEVYASAGHDKAVDWWTVGVLIHELLAGYTPFYGKEPNQIHREITRYAKHYPKVGFPKHFPKSCNKLLLGLLHPTPSKRLGNLRGGAMDVKRDEFFVEINWKMLEQKEYTPDFIPQVHDAYDAANFKSENEKKFAKTIENDEAGFVHPAWAEVF